MERVIICVTNDLSTDQRVHKVARTIKNYTKKDVVLAGRKKPGSPPVRRSYRTLRFRLPFQKGALFYAAYNLRLLIHLLFNKYQLIISNDLDTLPACSLAARLKKTKLFYDSHELFTEVPELVNRPMIKKIWEWIENKSIGNVNLSYTVCEPIAKIYAKKYHIPVHVIRNVPYKNKRPRADQYQKPTLIYQGALNKGRGLELMIRVMQQLPHFQLLIYGNGDIENMLRRQAGNSTNVKFYGYRNFEELKNLTPKAHIGLSWEENIGKNYYYAQPNKMFDYIQARIPVLVAPLPGMEQIISTYNVGEMLYSREPQKIVTQIQQLYEKRHNFEDGLEKAAAILNWENEEKKLLSFFKQ